MRQLRLRENILLAVRIALQIGYFARDPVETDFNEVQPPLISLISERSASA